jgi:long-chain fatty acid transport protein
LKRLTTTAAVVGFTALSLPAHATLGIFEHGSGIKSLGFGGISYVGIDETTALSANPAQAIAMGDRFDIGIDMLRVSGGAEIIGNAAGPDESFQFQSNYYPIPQLGLNVRVGKDWAFGVTAFAAGLGPVYPQNPYERFAGPDDGGMSASGQTSLRIGGLSMVAALALDERNSLGLSVNLQHQWLSVEGLLPFAVASESPGAVSNQGPHVSYGMSVTAGWTGQITPWLDAGLSYRTKAIQLRIEEYRGLLPDQGKLEIPAIFGGALLARPAEGWRLGFEYQHYAYQHSNGFGNGLDRLAAGRPLGSTGGPGFGFNNQNAYKFGVEHQLTTSLVVRGGFIYSTQLLSRHNILLNLQSPGTPKYHVTVGGTWTLAGGHELSAFYSMTDRRRVRGEGSIPDAFGGGEANISNRATNLGISYGRRFGGTAD